MKGPYSGWLERCIASIVPTSLYSSFWLSLCGCDGVRSCSPDGGSSQVQVASFWCWACRRGRLWHACEMHVSECGMRHGHPVGDQRWSKPCMQSRWLRYPTRWLGARTRANFGVGRIDVPECPNLYCCSESAGTQPWPQQLRSYKTDDLTYRLQMHCDSRRHRLSHGARQDRTSGRERREPHCCRRDHTAACKCSEGDAGEQLGCRCCSHRCAKPLTVALSSKTLATSVGLVCCRCHSDQRGGQGRWHQAAANHRQWAWSARAPYDHQVCNLAD